AWNEIQGREAREFHSVPGDRIAVTGAQLFDHWFDRVPSRSRPELHEHVGLAGCERYVLYVGSSRNITRAKREIVFVHRWLEALRGSGDPVLEKLGVLVRPHPYNVVHWAKIDLAPLG